MPSLLNCFRAFLSGISQLEESTFSNDGSEDFGINSKVVDNGRLREDLAERNKELNAESLKLRQRLHKLESVRHLEVFSEKTPEFPKEETEALTAQPGEEEAALETDSE